MYYYEDLTPGLVIEGGPRKVTAEEIIEFAQKYDPQPFHLTDEGGKQTHFGGLVASGWHTCGMAMAIMVETVLNKSASLGSPGLTGLEWKRPVRPGDDLRVLMRVLDAKPSQSRPEMGRVQQRVEVFNQNDELVMWWESYGLFSRRPADGVASSD